MSYLADMNMHLLVRGHHKLERPAIGFLTGPFRGSSDRAWEWLGSLSCLQHLRGRTGAWNECLVLKEPS